MQNLKFLSSAVPEILGGVPKFEASHFNLIGLTVLEILPL